MIFLECQVELPLQAILNRPMAADRLGKPLARQILARVKKGLKRGHPSIACHAPVGACLFISPASIGRSKGTI